ncbi:DUF4153 domain-containing protein [Hymenobacter cellulosilyticus]|uniref:DUF4153 domain-containing protein n=1 Tax=Hymenobacter cellulosilyticus TaxID=2932248 RepID=A0A8T9Q3G6_9BACT|nr:DUF4153 domain-containing protein [Hymenobacter cellulosilyticus]UOQ70340.1 DUF4153 domain-containing protein [Hymenobacter cellulosilyticus]
MKFPSLQHVVAEAARVIRRFPLTLLCALVLCVVLIYINHLNSVEERDISWLFPVMSTALLGLTLTLSASLASERYHWSGLKRLAALAGTIALLGLWYAVCPAQANLVWGLRLFVLLVAQHLLVAVVPYLPELRRKADTPSFWRYNETLFLRILTAGLYSGVLYAGCALALVAVKNLFEVHLSNNIYSYLFTVLATVFNTWFFLAGVPADFAELEQEAPYPKGLKVFTQFVLLPLVLLYLGILYAYLGRILVRWELPEGWVSLLILAFSVAGIFALLLIHPIREQAGNAWIRTFARWFYLALLPLLGLLVVAIDTRIGAYGITEERYYVLVLALWLAGILAYSLVRQGRGIIWIPASLAVVALLTVAGPWGAFAVAERSQLRELKQMAAQYRLLQNGKLDNAGWRQTDIPLAARKRITSIFEFFNNRSAVNRLQPLFTASLQLPDSLRNKAEWVQKDEQMDRLFAVSRITRADKYESEDEDLGKVAEFQREEQEVEALGGGRYYISTVQLYMYRTQGDDTLVTFRGPEGHFQLRSTHDGRQIVLEQEAPGRWEQLLVLEPGALADSLTEHVAKKQEDTVILPGTQLTLAATGRKATLSLYLHRLARREKQHKVSYDYGGSALLELKK